MEISPMEKLLEFIAMFNSDGTFMLRSGTDIRNGNRVWIGQYDGYLWYDEKPSIVIKEIANYVASKIDEE